MSLVVGLTGGIGSGKSAVAEEFSRLGATVVDTDVIAHELTAPGGAAIDSLRREFGDAYIDALGAMDRTMMRELVFRDVTARQRLEAILHPMVREESNRQIAAATGLYVVHVIPLLVESNGNRRQLDTVLVVDCDDATQLARVRARNNFPDDQIRRIINAQASREKRRAAADDVIDNSGTLDALHQKVRALHLKYLALARSG